MAEAGAEDARPATVDDLKLLLRSLNEQDVDYLLIGGYALYALGYQRGTTDIDVLLPRSREQGERVRRALLVLPDKVSSKLEPMWFEEGDTIIPRDAMKRAVAALDLVLPPVTSWQCRCVRRQRPASSTCP